MVAFEESVAVVTGGGSGIGCAIARGLHARGASVVAVDVDTARLINNAGVSDRFAAALETSDEHWDRIIRLNLEAPFFLSRALLPTMLGTGDASIAITGSVVSVIGGGGGAAYTVAKHGLLGLTRSLAVSYGPHGVRVNCILPGAVRTAMTVSDDAQVSDADAVIAATTAGRWAEPEEVAAVALFLCSDEASFVHGSAYTVDGGWTLV